MSQPRLSGAKAWQAKAVREAGWEGENFSLRRAGMAGTEGSEGHVCPCLPLPAGKGRLGVLPACFSHA